MIPYHRLFVGSACDNQCLHCPSRDREKQIDPSTLGETLKGFPHGQNIAYVGGEPLLHEDLFSLIAAARHHGAVRIKIVTNGRRLADADLLGQLLEAGCRVYEVKLFGSNQTIHDGVTNVRGSFEETLQGMVNLAEASHSEAFENAVFVTARIEIWKSNLEDLASAMGLAASLGVDRVLLVRRGSDFPIAEGARIVANVVRTATLNRIWSMCQGFPPCTMVGCERHLSELLEPAFHDGKKPQGCQNCCVKDICVGPPAEYLRHHGTDAFKALTAAPYLEDVKRIVQKRYGNAQK